MSNAANLQEFLNPATRAMAMGKSTDPKDQIWLDPNGRTTTAPANGGVINPQRHDIPAGTTLYRFATITDGAERVMSGSWWMERAELNQLIRFSQVNKKSLGYAVRLLCAVPPEWGSALNFLIAVRTRVGLAAWRGLANSAAASSPASRQAGAATTVINTRNDIAAWRLHQLFIPGLRNPGATAGYFIFQGQWQTEGAPDWLYRPA